MARVAGMVKVKKAVFHSETKNVFLQGLGTGLRDYGGVGVTPWVAWGSLLFSLNAQEKALRRALAFLYLEQRASVIHRTWPSFLSCMA